MLKKQPFGLGASRSWKSIFIDIGAIIFSVLFALALDDWRVDRDTNEKVENVIATIRHEIAENKAQVQQALAYHEPLVQNLSAGTHRLGGAGLEERGISVQNEADMAAVLKRMFMGNSRAMFEEIKVLKSSDTAYYARVGARPIRLELTADSLLIFGEGNIQLRPARLLNSAWETAIATQTTIHMDFELVAAMTELVGLHEIHDSTVSRIIEILYTGNGSATSALQDLRWFEASMLEQYAKIEAILDKE
ncbi:MAG: hypothetical protein AAF564_05005 [Bacteroidota bacterium]